MESIYKLSVLVNMIDRITGPSARIQQAIGKTNSKFQDYSHDMARMATDGAVLMGTIMDLFYPEMLLQLGAYNFTKGIRIKVYSSVDIYFDWAKVTFTKQFTDNIKLSKLDTVSIYLGYGGNYNKVFDGFIAHDFALSENIN